MSCVVACLPAATSSIRTWGWSPRAPAGHHDGHPHQVQALAFVVADRQRDQDQGVHLTAGGEFLEEAPPLPLVLDLVEEHVEIGAVQGGHDAAEHGRVEPVGHVGGHHRDPAGGSARQPGGIGRDRVRQVLGEVLDPLPGLGETPAAPLSARETVAMETPAG